MLGKVSRECISDEMGMVGENSGSGHDGLEVLVLVARCLECQTRVERERSIEQRKVWENSSLTFRSAYLGPIASPV